MEPAMAKVDQPTQKRHVYKRALSPVGRLTLVGTDDGLAAILWENDRPRRVRLTLDVEENGHPVLVETERQLAEYFAGRRERFALRLDLSGTAFQRKVWNALLTIPFGETRTYAQIA
jgi:methylated-DNA-[protein]-cysteine S-methyltransferase